jgi:hypothetical protein
MPAQVRERFETLAIGRSHGEYFTKLVIRNADGMSGAELWPILETGQADVEIAALDGLLDRRPGHLEKARLSSKTGRDHPRDLDVEATHLRRIRGIGFDERRTAFGVAAPAEFSAGAYGRRPRRLTGAQNQDRREEWCPHGYQTKQAATRRARSY